VLFLGLRRSKIVVVMSRVLVLLSPQDTKIRLISSFSDEKSRAYIPPVNG